MKYGIEFTQWLYKEITMNEISEEDAESIINEWKSTLE